MAALRSRPMISVAAAAGLCEAIERAGRDPEEVLRPLGLRRESLSAPDGLMPAADFTRALEEAARLTGDDCFGLHLGERHHPKSAGPLAYVVLNSPTLAVAFANIGRYLRVHNEAAKVSFERDGRWAYLRHTLDVPVEQSRQHAELSLAAGLGLIRLMVGSEWAPVEVQFGHKAPSSTAEHARVFSAPVRFGCGSNAFVMEADLLDRHVPGADQRLYPIMLRYLDRILEAMPHEDGVVLAARKCIGETLRQEDPTLAHVAEQLSVAPRTLQRKLRGCGVDFKRLVEDTRRRFAVQYLDDRRNTLTDVAFLLGYSEVSAFNRAFKRWTGSTPSDYRRRRHVGDA
jgi:AraC-like DNA-binding protein/DNA-binding transcriptional ArsR family regulator